MDPSRHPCLPYSADHGEQGRRILLTRRAADASPPVQHRDIGPWCRARSWCHGSVHLIGGREVMGASEEAVVRRLYEEMNTGRKLQLAEDLFTADHVFHD